MNTLVMLQTVHGMLAALAIASCLHPIFTVRQSRYPSTSTCLSGWLAAAVTALTFGLGLYLYGDYRAQIKPWLLEHRPSLHLYWFEAKEALAYLTLSAAIGGALVLQSGRDVPRARVMARCLFSLAFLGSVSAAGIGVIVASVRGF